MPIPDFQTLMLPVLQVHADGNDWVRAPLRDALAAWFDLTAAELCPEFRRWWTHGMTGFGV